MSYGSIEEGVCYISYGFIKWRGNDHRVSGSICKHQLNECHKINYLESKLRIVWWWSVCMIEMMTNKVPQSETLRKKHNDFQACLYQFMIFNHPNQRQQIPIELFGVCDMISRWCYSYLEPYFND